MVPFQVSQHIPRVLPPIVVSADGTESAVEPASLVTAKEHPIYLRECATTMVFAGFLSGHLTSQRLLGYPVQENPREESNSVLLPAVSATAFCYNLYVWRVRSRQARHLAVDYIVTYMRCHHRAH